MLTEKITSQQLSHNLTGHLLVQVSGFVAQATTFGLLILCSELGNLTFQRVSLQWTSDSPLTLPGETSADIIFCLLFFSEFCSNFQFLTQGTKYMEETPVLFGDCNFSLFNKPGSKGLMLLMLHVRAVFIVCQQIGVISIHKNLH